VVNMQLLMEFALGYTAALACMPVAGTGAARLPLPIPAVVWFKSATPRRVVLAVPILRLPPPEAFHITKVMIVAQNLVRLALNVFATVITLNNDGVRYTDKTLGTLPGTAALSIAKVVFLDSARRNALFFAAPVTGGVCLGPRAAGRTIMALRAPSMPRRALKDNATSFASNLHAHSIHQNSRNVKRARRGTEMIAEARLAHWLENVQLELI